VRTVKKTINTPLFVRIFYAPPNSLKDSNVSSKVKTMKENGIRVRSLIHNTSWVIGACWNFEMGTRTSDKQVNYSYGPT
jgi:hypothetical protein